MSGRSSPLEQMIPGMGMGMGMNGMNQNLMNGGGSMNSFSQSNLIMTAMHNLRTGDAMFDMIIGAAMAAAVTAFFKMINSENIYSIFEKIKNLLITIFTWLWELIKSKPKPKVHHPPPVPIYRVTIRHEYKRKRDDAGVLVSDKLDGDDNYITDNDTYFDAMFSFLSSHPGDMTNGEIAMRFVGACNFDHQRYRLYETMVKPLETIEIEGFKISLNETVIEPPKQGNNSQQQEQEIQQEQEQEQEKEKSKEKSSSSMLTKAMMRSNKMKIERGNNGQALLDKNGNLIMSVSEIEDSITYKKKITIESTKPIPMILEFIDKIYREYIDRRHPVPEKRKDEKEPKFIYMIDKIGDSKVYFNRRELETRMQFKFLFFPEKEKFMRRIDKFMRKETPYSKFTMLLHGSPGGGKTSFIKALHNYTDCNVICLRLDKFKSLEQLMDIFHEETIHSAEWNRKVPINRRIYLLEDVDAADKIVLRRDNEKEKRMKLIKAQADEHQKKIESRKKENKRRRKERGKLERKKNRLEVEFSELQPISGKELKEMHLTETEKRKKLDSFKNEIDDIEDELEELHSEDENFANEPLPNIDPNAVDDYTPNLGVYGYRGSTYYNSIWDKKEPEPSIKLADILNLLDGVLELNGCFVVLTTNYKDKLDEALIRPGRITFDLELGPIRKVEMREMIEKFLPEYKDGFKAQLDWKKLGLQYIDYEANADYTWEEVFEHYLEIIYQEGTMPCRFEAFCINEDYLHEVIINMDKHLVWLDEEKEKKRKSDEAARKRAKEEAEAEARRLADIDERIETNRKTWDKGGTWVKNDLGAWVRPQKGKQGKGKKGKSYDFSSDDDAHALDQTVALFD